jgi:hypothetical protein
MAVASDDLALGDALRPATADFVEIEVGMLRTTNIFAPRMLNGLVLGETLTDRDKRLPEGIASVVS